jgi:4-hydroxy-tetrahydrodipicolinate synthase
MFRGLYTALITPFKDDESIDLIGMHNLVKQQFEAKVDGIILFGTSGEGSTVTYAEREEIIASVLTLVKKLSRTTLVDAKPFCPYVLVSTGTNSTSTTIELSLQAERLGADGVMVVSPYYNRPSQEGLYQHYKAISEAINLPIMLYNIPSRTGVNIDDKTLMRLMNLKNIVALKDYDSLRPIRLYIDWDQYEDFTGDFAEDSFRSYELFTAACTNRFTILAGDDVNSLSIYVNGGHGCVSVASNIMPKECYELHQAVLAGNFHKARALHAHMHPIYNALFCEVNPVPVKYAAYKMGLIDSQAVRLPLCQLSEASKIKLNHIMKKYKLLSE